MHQVPNDKLKHTIPMSVLPYTNNSVVQDLLWISKQQQQHPLTHIHPLKNTIRINSRGIKYKFDGKQWRPLCQSSDGFECRNLSFRSSLCQKHFYKIHLFKRSYSKQNSIPRLSLKRALLSKYQQQQQQSSKQNNIDEDDSIQVIENNDAIVSKQEIGQSQSEFNLFSIDCEPNISAVNEDKSESSIITYASRIEGLTKRLDSTNAESIISNESESSSLSITMPKLNESIPSLTRTEEKSLANELIHQLPIDITFSMGEQIARRRFCEIIYDNYSHKFLPSNISSEWFYDFLLRNPRIPIHFQSWFSSIKSILPSSDHLIDIKIWELGLITRSSLSSSSSSIS